MSDPVAKRRALVTGPGDTRLQKGQLRGERAERLGRRPDSAARLARFAREGFGDRILSQSIVEFRRPPIVEVVAGVAIDGLGDDAGPLLSAFWVSELRGEFPDLQQQPPYSSPTETFPIGSGAAGVELAFGFTPNTRLWAAREGGGELIQLQRDWFACNWRKVQPNSEYDRWPQRLKSFSNWFSRLERYLEIPLKIRQCEVSYINHIRPGRVWERHADFHRIFNVSLGPGTDYPLEQMSAQAQFILGEEASDPRGRLYARVMPAFERDGRTPLYVFELTARGAPEGNGLDGELSFLDRGREAIVKSFIALTTEAMHQEWGMVK